MFVWRSGGGSERWVGRQCERRGRDEMNRRRTVCEGKGGEREREGSCVCVCVCVRCGGDESVEEEASCV